MTKRLVETIPTDGSEHDRLVTEWLETHHIRAENVRGYTLDRQIGRPEVLILEVYTSGVAEVPPPVLFPGREVTEAEADELKKRFMEASRKGPAETQIITPPLHWSQEVTEAFKKVYSEEQARRMRYEGPIRHDPEAGR